MDIHITYETLFDLLRKERGLVELQQLDSNFWLYVVSYLKDRSSFLEKTSLAEQEKTRLQLNNIKSLVKEIYGRREQKILNLAMNVIKSDNSSFVDTKNMLGEEKKLFDETLELLKKYKQGVILQVFNNQLPIIEGVEYNESEAQSLETSGDSKEQIQNPILQEEKTVSEEPSAQEPIEVEELMIKFIVAVPKFLGKNKQIFGPYDEGAIATLPNNIAQILLKKGKAQKLMAD